MQYLDKKCHRCLEVLTEVLNHLTRLFALENFTEKSHNFHLYIPNLTVTMFFALCILVITFEQSPTIALYLFI